MLSKEDVNLLPDKPGVYFFKSRSSELLYIGKAKSLRDRVRSYTYRSYRHSKRTRQLVRRTAKLDHTVCGSELEALLLESRLIKEHLPEYNVQQREYRNYPFVKITMNEDFPRVLVTWEIEPDGAKYMGPFRGWRDAEETVKAINRLFPVRKCNGNISGWEQKACLNYQIGKCLGPCRGKISRSDYRKMMGSIIRLLSGRRDKLIKDMEWEMTEAASRLQFERAARLRDGIIGIREIIFRQQFQVNAVDHNNLIAVYPSREADSVELFFIRKGEMAEQKKISIPDQQSNEVFQTIRTDIERIFFRPSESRQKPMGQLEVDAMNIISRWLYRHREDQSLVYIRKKRSRTESVASATSEIEQIIHILARQTATSDQ